MKLIMGRDWKSFKVHTRKVYSAMDGIQRVILVSIPKEKRRATKLSFCRRHVNVHKPKMLVEI